jgi:hypothetical protein
MATVAPSANDLTRQQLDELDALLQRMLSLPLNPPESLAPNPPAAAFAPPLPTPVPMAREVPTPSPAPRLFANPAPIPEARSAPEPSPIAAPWKDLTPTPEPIPEPPRPVIAPPQKIEKPRPAPRPVTSAPAPVAVESVPVYVPPRPEPVPFLLVPLVGFNAALNWFLGLFGLPGRILRSGFVKTLFGLAGLGLLIYTGMKVAQIHGLVTLPATLPWPR